MLNNIEGNEKERKKVYIKKHLTKTESGLIMIITSKVTHRHTDTQLGLYPFGLSSLCERMLPEKGRSCKVVHAA